MPTPACANCGYSLAGLAPRDDGWVICPECSLPQSPSVEVAPKRFRRFRGPYGLSLFLSLGVHAVSWALALTYADERHAPPFVPFFIITSPLTSTVLGASLGCWRARQAWAGSKNRGWRVTGLIVVTATFNVLLFLPIFFLLLALAVPSF